MDGHPLRGQRFLEQDEIGASGRGTHHHPRPEHVKEPAKSPFQQSHLGLREAWPGSAGAVDAVARMDEDHGG